MKTSSEWARDWTAERAEAVLKGLTGYGGKCAWPDCNGDAFKTDRSLGDWCRAISNAAEPGDDEIFLYTCDLCGAGRWLDSHQCEVTLL